MNGATLVATAWKAFQAARAGLGQPVPDWSELEDSYTIPFSHAALAARDYALEAETMPEGTASFAEAACKAFDAYASALGASEPPTARQLLPFEAVARHVVNALAWDEEDHGNLEDHESAWTPWAEQKSRALPEES